VIGYGNTPAERLAPAIDTLATLVREMEGNARRRAKAAPAAASSVTVRG
jgi:GntR family transcriptional regulator / MocR family aminotransferase